MGELFRFVLAYERLVEEAPQPEGETLMEELRQRVLADPRRRVAVESLAAEHGMSRSAFSHYFRARTGLTPARFMTDVQVPARLLVTTRLPLAHIAHQCGFANANHFGKVFRRLRPQSTGACRRSVG
jgi:transcriptional regulator GlxA family with amidase domain